MAGWRSDFALTRGSAETECGALPVAPAKIRIPAAKPDLVRREPLETVLDAHLARPGPPVLAITAPAGAGKTTLLAGWAARKATRHGTPIAWVSLDSSDNNPVLLWSAVQRALEGGARLTGLPAMRAPRGGLDIAYLPALIAAVEAAPRPILLILDDVHEVHSPAAVHGLNFLLRHLPATLRVILAARFPPPLILPRLRIEGRLAEIGPDSLLFGRAEARGFLAGAGVNLTTGELDLLMEKTEGWAAGLRLAAMALARSAEPARRLTRFTGDQRPVADYLAGEVLARQPDDVQHLLLRTSVCRAFTADLAVALSGRENAGELLDRLERTSILKRHGDGPRRSYSCHPLLRCYLRAELDRRRPSARRDLHRTAAGWFRASARPLQALEHAIAAEDDELIGELITASGLKQLLTGNARRLRRILDTAPAHVLARPAVALVAATAALDLRDLPAADRCLRRMAGNGQLRSRRLRSLNATVSLYRARLEGDVRATLTALDSGWPGETGDVDLDVLAWLNRGTAAAWNGQHGRAKIDLRRALHLAVVERRDAAVLDCRTQLAALTAAEGDLAGMGAQARSALEFARQRNWGNTSRCAYLYALLGAEAYLRLDTERARHHAGRAVDLLAQRTDPTIELLARFLKAVIAFDTASDPHRVVAGIREHWQRLHGKLVSPALAAFLAPTEQRLALRVGEYAWAVDVLERAGAQLGPRGEHALLQANLQAHKGRISSACRLLAPVLAGRMPTTTVLTAVDAWLLDAHLAARSNDGRRAHEALRQALAIAEPLHALRPFHDAGQHVRDLLAQGTGRYGRLDRFAATVIGALPTPAGPADALTDRELALLAELPSMRTAEEIADSLFVSVNTVKTHLRGIYRKLGVRHRRDAIAAARQHGLL